MAEVASKRSQFKARLMECLIGKGLSWLLADTVSNASVEAIWKEWGGQHIYFSKGRPRKLEPEQIWEQFTGRNQEDLARKFGCSIRRIEQIVAMKTASLHSEKP